MNNEETIIMQPQKENKAQQTENNQAKKSAEKKNSGAAAAVAGVVGGGVLGAGVAVGVDKYMESQEEPVVEVVADDEPARAHASEHKPQAKPEAQHHEEPRGPINNAEEHAGEDQIAHNTSSQQNVHQTANEVGDEDEVEVLGVYENVTEDGVHQEAAVLTDGEMIAVVADNSGDGEADVVWIDENVNFQIDEGEVYDISGNGVQMQQFEDTYIAQHQEELMHEQDSMTCNAGDEQDYSADAPDLIEI